MNNFIANAILICFLAVASNIRAENIVKIVETNNALK